MRDVPGENGNSTIIQRSLHEDPLHPLQANRYAGRDRNGSCERRPGINGGAVAGTSNWVTRRAAFRRPGCPGDDCPYMGWSPRGCPVAVHGLKAYLLSNSCDGPRKGFRQDLYVSRCALCDGEAGEYRNGLSRQDDVGAVGRLVRQRDGHLRRDVAQHGRRLARGDPPRQLEHAG